MGSVSSHSQREPDMKGISKTECKKEVQRITFYDFFLSYLKCHNANPGFTARVRCSFLMVVNLKAYGRKENVLAQNQQRSATI